MLHSSTQYSHTCYLMTLSSILSNCIKHLVKKGLCTLQRSLKRMFLRLKRILRDTLTDIQLVRCTGFAMKEHSFLTYSKKPDLISLISNTKNLNEQNKASLSQEKTAKLLYV